jgi:hypothetical protein
MTGPSPRRRGAAKWHHPTSLARAERSATGQIVLAVLYWVGLVAAPAAGEPLLERGDFWRDDA